MRKQLLLIFAILGLIAAACGSDENANTVEDVVFLIVIAVVAKIENDVV